jgi:hypothetical protein
MLEENDALIPYMLTSPIDDPLAVKPPRHPNNNDEEEEEDEDEETENEDEPPVVREPDEC